MTTEISPATGHRYPLTMVCAVFRVPRTTVYAQTAVTVRTGSKRGPRTRGSDDELVAAIRTVLADTPFHGEGHRNVRVAAGPRLARGEESRNRPLRCHC